MSHVVSIDIEVADLDAIKAACARLGFEFREGVSYKWWGRHVGDYPLPAGFTPAELDVSLHSIVVPGARYSVGVFKSKTRPGFELLWDFIDHGLKEKMGGEKASRFVQAYGLEKVKRDMRLRGRPLLREESKADGSVKLVFAG